MRAHRAGGPIYHELPKGWRANDGATTAPRGAKWINFGSLWVRGKDGRLHKNPEFRQAYLITG